MLIQRITDEAVPDAAAGMKTAHTAGIVKAGALMAVATIVSRVTGLLAKIAIAAIIGDGIVNSSYTLANTLPNIVFELLVGGVLTSVAIPLLTRAQRSDADGGLAYTQRLMTLAVIGLAIATGLAVLGAPLLTRLYLSSGSTVDQAMATRFAVLLLPQIFFYGIAALFGAILNTKERFAANAWAPVLNNLVVIGVAVVLAVTHFNGIRDADHIGPTDLLILGAGTTVGIIVQAMVMIPSLRRADFRWKWRWGWDRRFAEAGGLLGWATVYVVISQVGVVVTLRVASGNSTGGIFFFQTASLIFQMPYGILGVAVLTAIMPRMSRHAAAGQLEDVKQDMSLAHRLSAVALLPVSAGLIVLGSAITVVLYRHGGVDIDSTLIIGGTLGGMAIGLVPLAMTLVQMRVFYAMKDGRTPTIVNAVMVAVRVPLMIASAQLGSQYVIPGLAASTAVSYIVGAVVGEIWLRARFGPMGTLRTLVTVGKMFLASAVGGAAAFYAADRTVGIIPTDFADALSICGVAGVTGVLVIAVMALLLRVDELLPVRNRLFRLLGVRTPRGTGRTSRGTGDPAIRPAMGESTGGAPVPGAPRGRSESARAPTGPRTSREQVTQRVTSTPGDPGTTPADQATVRVRPAGRDSEPTVDVGGSNTVNLGPSTTATTIPAVSPAPGASIGGRYRLVSLVASDSAGNRFWRAKDTVLPRDMAVTLLPDTNAASATVARTLRVGRLHHIGLPQTLDVGTEQGQSYVVGQWVDGATLTDLLADGPLEPDVATSITAKVSEAVAEAHRNGIALGAINPSLVRVNFDGQVRLSHVIAHGNATPDQDIRAVGGLLYLMLTGTWPLVSGPGGRGSNQPRSAAETDATIKVGRTGSTGLPPASTRLGREVPAAEVRPSVPEALSALAERALHPDEPGGIHAVGAIASLLRSPDISAASAAAVREPDPVATLSPAERRLIKERRIKLAIAALMLAAFAALIVIVVASLSKQFLTSIQDPSAGDVSGTAVATAQPVTPAASASKPTSAKPSIQASTSSPATGSSVSSPPSSAGPSTSSSAVAVGVPIKIVNATVYDPEGDGQKDNTGKVGRAFDGDAGSSWQTFIYNQQFPTVKHGVGLTLELEKAGVPTSIQVSSDTPGTTVEIRAAGAADLPLAQTRVVGTGTINAAPLTINLTNAPASKYLIVMVTKMAPSGPKFQSDINEITVVGN